MASWEYVVDDYVLKIIPDINTINPLSNGYGKVICLHDKYTLGSRYDTDIKKFKKLAGGKRNELSS